MTEGLGESFLSVVSYEVEAKFVVIEVLIELVFIECIGESFPSVVTDELWTKFGFQTYFFLNFFLKAARPSAPAPTKSMVAGSGTGDGASGSEFGPPGVRS